MLQYIPLAFGWIPIIRRESVHISVPLHDGTTFGLAKLGSRCGQRIEHCLKIERRAADNLEDLRCGSLLLQRLGELLFQVGVGCAKAGNVSSRLRLVRTKTGNASSAFRPFASQGDIVGTVTGPPCGRPSQGSSPS